MGMVSAGVLFASTAALAREGEVRPWDALEESLAVGRHRLAVEKIENIRGERADRGIAIFG